MATRVRLRADNQETTVTLDAGGAAVEGAGDPFTIAETEPDHWRVSRSGFAETGIGLLAGTTVWVQLGTEVFEFHVRDEAERDDHGTRGRDQLMPPMSATVIRLAVKPGDVVTAGETLVMLEAMKMELPIRAPYAGRVTAVHCREGELVPPGAVLIDLEPAAP